MTIEELVTISHATALDKGWHDTPRSFGDLVALAHSELSEALEYFREGRTPTEIFFEDVGKPVGIPIELVDLVIRIADMATRPHESGRARQPQTAAPA